MITLHHGFPTRSMLARFMLEETGLPYEIARVDWEKGQHKSPTYMALQPHGVIPVLEHDGHVIFECGAICLHLADQVPEKKLAPPVGSFERATYYQWCYYAIATELIALAKIAMNTKFLPPELRSKAVEEDGRRSWVDVAQVMTNAVRDREWLLGSSFSTADVLCGGSLWLADFVGVLGDHPELRKYYDRVRARPAFAKAFTP